MRAAFAVIGLLIASGQASADTATACFPDRETILALDYKAFDQTPDNGWRVVTYNNPVCEIPAADLIAEYRERHAGSAGIARYNDTLLNHEGQLRASNGQTARALALFRDVLAIHLAESDGAEDTNTLRDRAQIAFLEGDRAALIAARDQLAALPMPPGMKEAMDAAAKRVGRPASLEWPLNLAFTSNLVNCFGRSFREASDCPD